MQPTTVQELIHATGGRPLGVDPSLVVSGQIVIDSRQVTPGGVFWAVAGQHQDGHDFVHDAWQRQAALCVIDEDHATRLRLSWRRRPCLVVNNTLESLQQLARWHRERSDAFVIGVTGSVGKTTTRQMIHAVLSASNRGLQSPANFNNHLGVPLSLLQIGNEDEFAVLELGASRAGEIARLCDIALPEAGILTRIAPAHLDGFGSLDGVMQAKAELLQALPPEGFAVINGDDERCRASAIKARCHVTFVGEHAFNDLCPSHVELLPGRLRFRVDHQPFEVAAAGRHLLLSALSAIAVGRRIDMEDRAIAEGLATFEPAEGRCRPLHLGEWTVIDDTYNASPQSALAACHLLADWPGRGKKILCLGDMLALGAMSRQYHQELGERVAGLPIDRFIAFGPEAALAAQQARAVGMDPGSIGTCQDDETVLFLLDLWLDAGDVLLIKGSRGMQMERFISHLRQQASRLGEVPLKRSA